MEVLGIETGIQLAEEELPELEVVTELGVGVTNPGPELAFLEA